MLVSGEGLGASAEPRVLNRYRVLVQMKRIADDWKVADIGPV